MVKQSCGPCGGKGYWNTRQEVCTVCHGRGELLWNLEKSKLPPWCRCCSGKGHVSNTFFGGFSGKSGDICRVCRGYGRVAPVIVG